MPDTSKITTPGIYPGFPVDDYFADPCPEPSLTQSIAKILIERSPAHAAAAHPRLTPQPDKEPESYSAAKAIGTAAHAILIGRGKSVAVGNFSSWRTNAAKEFREEAEGEGRDIILGKHFVRAEQLVDAIRAQLDAAGLRSAFADGAGEVVIAWEEDGVWFRSMIDWMVSPVLLYDLKTSSMSVAPHVVGRRAADAGWDIQAAMQARGLDVLSPDGVGRRRFRFIAIENEEPHALVPVELSEAWLTMGRKKLAAAAAIWRHCMSRGAWPAYPAELIRPPYPEFLENRWLEREAEGIGPLPAPTDGAEPEPVNYLLGG